MSITIDNQNLVTSGLDCNINLWKLTFSDKNSQYSAGGYLSNVIENDSLICCINTSQNNPEIFLTGSKDGKIKMWNILNGNCEREFICSKNPVVEILLLENFDKGGKNMMIFAIASKDDCFYIINSVLGNAKILKTNKDFFVEFGCGISHKMQFLNVDGDFKISTISQDFNNKNISIWDFEFC